MSLWVSSLLLGMDGLLYMGMGVCMLLGDTRPPWCQQLAGAYPSLCRSPPLSCRVRRDLLPSVDDDDDDGERSCSGGDDPSSGNLLAFRMLAYLLVLVGLCRFITCFHWGCGYILLGLTTCLSEIAMLCHELLRYESLLLHRTMAVFLCNVAVSLVYIGAGLPYCR
jgi:hypothetical protein